MPPAAGSPITPLDPTGEEYRRAFEVFLASTNQKATAAQYLSDIVDHLPSRQVFVDAGAGRGDLTHRIAKHFTETIVVEPSTTMHPTLRATCPNARLLATTIEDADIGAPADLVLCAHVLYYLPATQWTATAHHMLNWVAPGGELVIALQNPNTDCMRLMTTFTGIRYDLRSLAEQLPSSADITLETVPATIHTRHEDDAATVAEFMLNLAPLSSLTHLPTHEDLRRYVRTTFTTPTGAFTFSCDQDFLRVRMPV